MATLQKIRSKGPLVVIVIGLALFAFVAGDLWKVLQPHQTKQEVGEINGKTVTAQEYQAMIEEVTKVQERLYGRSATDEDLTELKDDLWNKYVQFTLLEEQAEKIGLVVTDAEVKAIINEGVHPLLMQTPFYNSQTGAFDREMMDNFIQYGNPDDVSLIVNFIEMNLKRALLAAKYESLITQSVISNPVEAEYNYTARNIQSDVVVAAIPYSAIPDSTVTVKTSEIKARYNKDKERYRNPVETRNVKYIDVKVKASKADRLATADEVAGYAKELETIDSDYNAFIRATGSSITYVDLPLSAKAFPDDVAQRLDTVAVGEVCPSYYNKKDESYNTFKVIAKEQLPTVITYRQIQIIEKTLDASRVLADSITTAIKGGANFVQLAKLYDQEGEDLTVKSAEYEKKQMDAVSQTIISTLNGLAVNGVANIEFPQGNIVVQVTGREDVITKYQVAVVKRPIQFSMETYNKAYNELSQYIASNNSLEKMVQNAEEAGYRILDVTNLDNASYNVANIRGTHEALRWIFGAKPGAVSQLYECGNNDRLVVMALESIVKEGYSSAEAESLTIANQVRKDKKAEMIAEQLKGAKSIAELKAIQNVEVDTVRYITYSTPVVLALTHASEPALSGKVSAAAVNELSAPIKGNVAVYVVQVYNREQLEEAYDEVAEQKTAAESNARFLGRFIGDLIDKATVKDNRYLYF